MVDTSIILNKNGNDYIRRNYCVKNKFCSKLLTIVDDKGIPLYVNYNPGSRYDSKCLIKILDDFLNKTPDIVSFLVDTTCSYNSLNRCWILYIRYNQYIKKHGVNPIIAKNLKNKKREYKYR